MMDVDEVSPDADPAEVEPSGGWAWFDRLRDRWHEKPGRLWMRTITSFVVVSACTLVVFRTMHPSLLFTDTTPTGGDMGAHVLGPSYLRDHLLPSGRLSGWSMDWYAGFPMYRFYMVVPALAIVLLNLVMPYGVAFKLVAVSGLVAFPAACWAFGRLARFAYPLPVLFAVAGTIFLYDESFTIYGGNIASTMAGEFSFSIALTFTMLAFGFFARGLQDGTHRIWAAVLVALAALSHGIVLMFVFGGVALMGLVWMDRTRWRYTWTTIGTAILLSAFWVFPFLFGHAYMTDMKYGFEPGQGSFTSFWGMFFPLPAFFNVLFTALAVIGVAASVARRHLMGAWLGVYGVLLVGAVYVARESLPVIGLLWNPRLLPFLHLTRYLLAAVGVVEIVRGVVRLVELETFARRLRRRAGVPALLTGSRSPEHRSPEHRSPEHRSPELGEATDLPVLVPPPEPREPTVWRDDVVQPVRWWVTGTAVTAVVCLLTLGVLGFRFQQLPFGKLVPGADGVEYAWGPIRAESRRGFVDGWARWNFSGYEERPAYGEYYTVVQTMKALGEDPNHGCGRALWENTGDNNRYGTTMALMLLPFWTDGCIASMEGLFFEAAGTTPYHFLTAAALSKQSSNPVRELRYDNNNAELGVHYMEQLGVRYFLAYHDEAIAEADRRPELTRVAEAGPWRVYELADTRLVVPLDVQPVVVNGRGGDQRERWLEVGTSWFQRADEWEAVPVASGPPEWQRVDVSVDLSRRVGQPGKPGRRVDIVVPDHPIEPVSLPPIEVTDVELGTRTVNFSVDQVGVPVLVRVSYFPNWKVDGADGPYRVAPNMMVVVPTSTEVRLHYDLGGVDFVAYVATLVGIGLLVVFRRRGPVLHDVPRRLVEPEVPEPEVEGTGDRTEAAEG